MVAELRNRGLRKITYVGYAGYVLRPSRGPAWDVGVTRADVTTYRLRRRTVAYGEIYGGFLTDHLSLRLYYAPNYYETGLKTVYADLSGAFRPAPRWRAFGHAGVLTPVGGRRGPGVRRDRYDFSAGVARQFGQAEARAAWTRVTPNVTYVTGEKETGDALVLGLSYFF